jgi:NitT/TauT family transport system permease protein
VELATRLGLADTLILPPPSGILRSFWVIFVAQGNVWYHLFVTMTEVLVGFLAGSLLGIALAFLIGSSALFREYAKPYVIVLEATPRIAMGPLMIAWLGFGWSSKIGIVTLVCFFPPFMNTLTGMVNVNRDALQLFHSLRATRWQIFRKLMLPDAMPLIMAGLRLGMAAALGGALVAEFISANEGMGVLLNRYSRALNMTSAFAALLTLTFLGFVIFRGMEVADRRLVFWRHASRLSAVSASRRTSWQRRFAADDDSARQAAS